MHVYFRAMKNKKGRSSLCGRLRSVLFPVSVALSHYRQSVPVDVVLFTDVTLQDFWLLNFKQPFNHLLPSGPAYMQTHLALIWMRSTAHLHNTWPPTCWSSFKAHRKSNMRMIAVLFMRHQSEFVLLSCSSYPVQISLDAVVQDLCSQLGLCQLWPQKRRLHTHTLHTFLSAQIPAERTGTECYLISMKQRLHPEDIKGWRVFVLRHFSALLVLLCWWWQVNENNKTKIE